MRKKFHYLILLLFLLFTSILFSQSPWTKKKGEFYTQLNFSTIPKYTEVFGNPRYNTHREITDNTIQLYGEYGFSNKTTLVLNIPLKFITSGNLNNNTELDPSVTEAKTINTFGNVELGIKHNFYNKKWLVTGQFNIELNTSDYDETSGIRTGYDAYTFTPLINIGRSFKDYYIQVFTGFNFRTNNYSSNYKIGGEIGTKIIKKIWLIGFLDFVISINNGDYVAPIQNSLTALYINDQEYTAFGLKVIGEITPDFGLIAGVGGAFSGNNVATNAAFNIGIYHKINHK